MQSLTCWCQKLRFNDLAFTFLPYELLCPFLENGSASSCRLKARGAEWIESFLGRMGHRSMQLSMQFLERASASLREFFDEDCV